MAPNISDEDPTNLWISHNSDPSSPVIFEVLHPAIMTRFYRLFYLSINLIDFKRFSVNSFERCDNLNFLEVKGKLLEEIPEGLFRNCRNLTTIHLPGNRIRNIHSNSLQGLENLETLNLERNQLNSIDPDWFNILPSLKIFYISNNQLGNIQPEILPTQLTLLDLSHCGITQLHPDLFKNFTQLNRLFLNENEFTELPPEIFIDLKELQDLHLIRSKIRRLNSNAFGIHPKMNSLRIEYGVLDEIQPGFFDRFPNIWNFIAYKNKCVDVMLVDVKSIDFYENPVLHQCFANWFVPRP